MNGPDHFREAERLRSALPAYGINNETGLDRMETLCAAQVHATLALAAATIEIAAARGPGDITQEWTDIIYPRGGVTQ